MQDITEKPQFKFELMSDTVKLNQFFLFQSSFQRTEKYLALI